MMSPKVRITLALALAAVLLYGAWGPTQLPVTPDATWGTTCYLQTRSIVGVKVYPPQVNLLGYTVLSRWEEWDDQLGVTVVRERTLNHFSLALSFCATGVAAIFVGWGRSGVRGGKPEEGRQGNPLEQERQPEPGGAGRTEE